MDSFGSPIRLDFGTGHELAFTIFLYCLKEFNYYTEVDFESLVHIVFYRYNKFKLLILNDYTILIFIDILN